MELHFFAMFSPGFITGMMISRMGAFGVAMIGGIIFALSSVVLVIDTQEWNFILGMILVGIAWNFSFSAGTVMLTKSYLPHEATEVQAINDFILFSVAGAGSLISGVIYSQLGWLALIFVVSALMGLYILLFVVIYCYSINVTELSVDKEESLSHVASPILNHHNSNSIRVSINSTSDIKSEESESLCSKRSNSRANSIQEGEFNPRSKSLSDFLHDYERHVSFSSTGIHSNKEGDKESSSIAFVRTLSVT
eukprot:CAMPEP_0170058828 /NCGR_PEP_ID=MMETSP0019_2-20121128/1306_1 /TAXON_ID=98059 /ORGANISM="Dinobryon sp., Strain UTEXLB2267" /LENGTH=250 /DNA_ID=CAMNT_0010263869 /DNA_START=709 /DNA_END=1461 /DNA_ORIENTATION=-